MNFDDENNPFAESPARRATAQSIASQEDQQGYNPFTNPTAPIPASPSSPPAFSNVFTASSSSAVYETSPYVPTPSSPPVQQLRPVYEEPRKQVAVNVESPLVDKQKSVEESGKNLAEPKRPVTTSTADGNREKNFPPLPGFFPCKPCFYHNISADIPVDFQKWVRLVYYLWILYSITLFLNFIGGLSYLAIDSDGAASFGLSLVYLVLFVPLSYVCFFRPVYRAFKTDSSMFFMIFFFIGALFVITNILFAIGVAAGMCGFLRATLMSQNKGVGTIMLILGCLWSLITLLTVLLIIKVHRLYRLSGASLEQAQRELRTSIVTNPTVRGAARDAAAASINEALRDSQA